MHRWFVVGIIGLILAGSIAAAVFLWTRQAEDDYPRSSSWPSYVSISADGNYIAAVYSKRGDVLLFSRDDSVPLWGSKMEDITEAVSISENAEYIAVGARKHLYLFSKDNATPLWMANVSSEDATQITSDGDYIVGMNGDIHFFSKDNNEPLWSVGGSISFALASDGQRLALASYDKIYLFGPENNDPLWSFNAGENLWFTVTSISSDGSYTAVGSGNGKLYLFGSEDNVPKWIYYSDKYLKPAISTDSNYIAAAVSGGATYLDEPDGGELYLFNRADNVPVWTTSWSCFRPKIDISSDGSYIIVGEEYGKLSLFSRDSSTPIWTYQFPKNIWVSSVSMSADGQYIAVGTGGEPASNIATSIYLFSKDSNQPLWVYYHEV